MKPYTAKDVAHALGISTDTLYRTRETRHLRDGLPRPICERGPLKFERSGFDAWLTRHHPMRPPAPANDPVAPPDAATDDEHRLRLARAYAPVKPVSALDSRRRQAGG